MDKREEVSSAAAGECDRSGDPGKLLLGGFPKNRPWTNRQRGIPRVTTFLSIMHAFPVWTWPLRKLLRSTESTLLWRGAAGLTAVAIRPELVASSRLI
jgi:hypothetical protein